MRKYLTFRFSFLSSPNSIQNKTIKIYIYFILVLLVSGCANLSSLQDGRTLQEGILEFSPILTSGGYYYSLNKPNPENEDDNYNRYIPIIPSLRTKIGFGSKFDAGVILDLSSSFGVTSKYQIMGNNDAVLNASIGLDLGTNLLALFYEKCVYYYSVPFYLSYNPHPKFAIFATPRYSSKSDFFYNDSFSVNSGDTVSDYKTFSYGLIYGKKEKFGIELANIGFRKYQPEFLSIFYSYSFSMNKNF